MKKIKQYLLFPFLVLFETVICYLTIIIPLEYFFTEKFLVFLKIDGKIKTIIFLIFFIIFFLVNHLIKTFNNFSRKLSSALLILFSLSLLANRQYSRFYSSLQKIPRIYSIRPETTLQGDIVTIWGKNFGQIWQDNTLYLSGKEVAINNWQEGLIEAIIPIPDNFGVNQLYIITREGRQSNKIDIYVKNPSLL